MLKFAMFSLFALASLLALDDYADAARFRFRGRRGAAVVVAAPAVNVAVVGQRRVVGRRAVFFVR